MTFWFFRWVTNWIENRFRPPAWAWGSVVVLYVIGVLMPRSKESEEGQADKRRPSTAASTQRPADTD